MCEWRDRRPVRQRERRRDVVERPLRHSLEEREHRRRERRGDAGHFNPGQSIAALDHGLVVDAARDPEARAEAVLVEAPRRTWIAVEAGIFELLGLEVEDSDLI